MPESSFYRKTHGSVQLRVSRVYLCGVELRKGVVTLSWRCPQPLSLGHSEGRYAPDVGATKGVATVLGGRGSPPPPPPETDTA